MCKKHNKKVKEITKNLHLIGEGYKPCVWNTDFLSNGKKIARTKSCDLIIMYKNEAVPVEIKSKKKLAGAIKDLYNGFTHIKQMGKKAANYGVIVDKKTGKYRRIPMRIIKKFDVDEYKEVKKNQTKLEKFQEGLEEKITIFLNNNKHKKKVQIGAGNYKLKPFLKYVN